MAVPLLAGLAIAGTAASAAGGAASAAAANQAGRKARDLTQAQGAGTMLGARRALYGGGDSILPILERLEPGLRERFVRDVFGIDDRSTGTYRDLTVMTPQQLTDFVREMGADTSGGAGPGYLAQMRGLAEEFSGRQAGLRRGYDADTQNFRTMAAQHGRGEAQRIDRDAARTLTGANRTTQAQLQAAGLGNTSAVANQTSANARLINEGAGDAKRRLADDQIDRMLALLERRSGGRAALEEGHLGRDLALRVDPMERELAINLGPNMNPFAGVNNSQYYPGASALGSALTSAGNAATTAAGMGLGAQGPPRASAPAAAPVSPFTWTGGAPSGGAGGPAFRNPFVF